jgi:hypothetical protein
VEPEKMISIEEIRAQALAELISYASMYLSVAQRQEMYRRGTWTRILNALDWHSPHAVTTEDDIKRWRREGILHVQSIKAELEKDSSQGRA